MSDTEVVDKPETESKVEESLFAYDHDADPGVDEQQDTPQEQAEPETPTEQDSTEDSETDQPGGEDDSEATEVEQADSQTDEEKSPTEDPEAHQFWQSKYQKAESKLGMKPEEIPAEHAELIKTFMDNPEHLQGYAEYLTNRESGTEPADSPQEEGPKTLERPQKPEKPVGYDHYEAFNDPESDSFQYRLAKEQYLEDLAEYADQKADSTRQELTEKEKQREQQAQKQKVQAQWYNHLTQKEGFTDEQFKDFWQWKDNPELPPEDIITAYRAVKGLDDTAESETETTKRPSKPTSQESKKKSPPSPATTAGAGNQREASTKKGEKDQLFGYF